MKCPSHRHTHDKATQGNFWRWCIFLLLNYGDGIMDLYICLNSSDCKYWIYMWGAFGIEIKTPHGMLTCHIGVPAPSSSVLLMTTLEGNGWWLNWLDPYHPRERSRLSSRPLASALPSPIYCGSWENEAANESFFFLSVCLNLFQMKLINKNFKFLN